MPLLLSQRAGLVSPLDSVTATEARMLRLPVGSAAYHRVRSGVYVGATAWRALAPWQRYHVRVHAYLRTNPDAILSYESAAVIHGLPLFGEPRDIHVHDPDRRSSRRYGDVCVHTSADRREVDTIGGIRVTTLVDTVADLARVLPPAHALAVVDAAISTAQGGSLELPRLRARAEEQAAVRGRVQLAWLWQRADGRAESPGESISRAVIEWSGFETPDLQGELRYEGAFDRVDFLFPSTGAIGESDGWGKYDLADAAAAEAHLKNEKRREDRLRRNGHPFARWDYSDAVRVTPLCTALLSAGVAVRRPPQPAMLATLRTRSGRTSPPEPHQPQPQAQPSRRSRETADAARHPGRAGAPRRT